MLRIDPANHFFGLRINVFTSIVVFLGAVLFLYLRRHVTREDPAVVWGPDRPGQRGRADEPGAPAGDGAGAPSGESADGPAAAPTTPADEPHPADKGPGTG
jgi:hypothetical protein